MTMRHEPDAGLESAPGSILAQLLARGVSRRDFLKACGALAGALALPSAFAGTLARGLAAAQRAPVIWLELQDCTGDTESFLRASRRPDPLRTGQTLPSLSDLLLDLISLEYHEALMAPSGDAAAKSLDDVVATYPGQYVVVVEGSIPTAHGGVYCTIHGETALALVRRVCPSARAVIAVGSCGWDGGLPRALPNSTGAVGVKTAVPGIANFVALPGCPVNVVNVSATIAYLLAMGQLPPRESSTGLPHFAYSQEIHERCERKNHYERNRFVQAWGDAGHRAGYCLFKMGCRGPEAKSNCNFVKWNDATSWPVAAGHGCIGCTTANFWDRLAPFYTPLPDD